MGALRRELKLLRSLSNGERGGGWTQWSKPRFPHGMLCLRFWVRLLFGLLSRVRIRVGAPFAEALFGSLFEVLFEALRELLVALLETFALIFQGLVYIRSCLHPAWPGGAIETRGGALLHSGRLEELLRRSAA